VKKRMVVWGLIFAVFGWIMGIGKGPLVHLDEIAIDAVLFGALGLGVGFLLSKLPKRTDSER
jgi:hypothetical protein